MATKQTPTLGRIVHYKVTAHDADRMSGHRPEEGDALPAMVVAVADDDTDVCNLDVFCDGPQVYWVKSVGCGDEPGQYQWPKTS